MAAASRSYRYPGAPDGSAISAYRYPGANSYAAPADGYPAPDGYYGPDAHSPPYPYPGAYCRSRRGGGGELGWR